MISNAAPANPRPRITSGRRIGSGSSIGSWTPAAATLAHSCCSTPRGKSASTAGRARRQLSAPDRLEEVEAVDPHRLVRDATLVAGNGLLLRMPVAIVPGAREQERRHCGLDRHGTPELLPRGVETCSTAVGRPDLHRLGLPRSRRFRRRRSRTPELAARLHGRPADDGAPRNAVLRGRPGGAAGTLPFAQAPGKHRRMSIGRADRQHYGPVRRLSASRRAGPLLARFTGPPADAFRREALNTFQLRPTTGFPS